MIENGGYMKRIHTWVKGLMAFWHITAQPNQDMSPQAGTIHWKDGNLTKIDSFSEISVELVYYWWNRNGSSHHCEGYHRNISRIGTEGDKICPAEGTMVCRILLPCQNQGIDRKETDRGKNSNLGLDGYDHSQRQLTKQTRVTFFHQKRKINIRRIEFE